MMGNLSPESLRALQIALKNENETVLIYQHMMNRVKNSVTQALLAQLIEEEFLHEKRIRDKISENNHDEPVSFEDIEVPNRRTIMELELTNCTILELINLAIENEKISRDFYQAQFQRVEDPEVRKIFQWLAEQEDEHIKNLQMEYDAHKYYEEVGFDGE